MNPFVRFYNDYISVNLKDFKNIGFDLEINKLLFFAVVGLCAACFFINYLQNNVATVLKKLMRLGAYGEENAKTLSELGLSDSRAAKKLLSLDSGSISKAVCRIGLERPSYEEYMKAKAAIKANKKKKRTEDSDVVAQGEEKASLSLSSLDGIESAKFYIPEEMREYAERTLTNNSSSLVRTVLLCALIFGFYIVIVFAMPSILSLINSILA